MERESYHWLKRIIFQLHREKEGSLSVPATRRPRSTHVGFELSVSFPALSALAPRQLSGFWPPGPQDLLCDLPVHACILLSPRLVSDSLQDARRRGGVTDTERPSHLPWSSSPSSVLLCLGPLSPSSPLSLVPANRPFAATMWALVGTFFSSWVYSWCFHSLYLSRLSLGCQKESVHWAVFMSSVGVTSQFCLELLPLASPQHRGSKVLLQRRPHLTGLCRPRLTQPLLQPLTIDQSFFFRISEPYFPTRDPLRVWWSPWTPQKYCPQKHKILKITKKVNFLT